MTRLQTLKAQLAAEGGTPLMWDTWHQTLYKLALAQGATFENCCRLETRHQLEDLIESTGGTPGPTDGGITTEGGDVIITEGGDVIVIE